MSTHQTKSSYISLGVIGAAHGVRGDLKVKSFTETPEDLARYVPLYLGEGGEEVRISKIRTVQGDKMVVHFEGIDDRNQAELLKGLHLMIERTQLPEIEDEDTFYHSDLIGLKVLSEKGELLGSVQSVNDFGAGHILEIKSTSGEVTLVAFTKDYVPEVSLEKGIVVVADVALTLDEEVPQ